VAVGVRRRLLLRLLERGLRLAADGALLAAFNGLFELLLVSSDLRSLTRQNGRAQPWNTRNKTSSAISATSQEKELYASA